jgi:hypothetical protein
MKTYDEWLQFVQEGGCLCQIPESLLTRELCLAAVTYCGLSLEDVPESLLTREIYLAAVTCDGWMLRYVPENLRDYAICQAAIANDHYRDAINHVPENLIGRNFLEILASSKRLDV